MVDPNLIEQIVGIGVACGTIALAIATFAIVRQSKQQLTELRRQNLLSSSINEPILKVSDFKFIGNQSQARITNVGGGRARLIGMSVRFDPSEMMIYGDKLENKIQLFSRKDPKIDVKFELKGQTAYPSEVINHQSEDGNTILNPNGTIIFSSEMLFGIGAKNVIDKKNVITKKAFTFDELREYLKQKNIHLIAVDVGIIGKDMMENPTPLTRIAKFFVDFKKHKTFEEAYAEYLAKGESPYFLPLSQEELRWQDGFMYRHLKSQQKSEIE